MKHSWRVSCLVTALVLLLTACGTGGTDTSPTAEPSASEPAASEPAASEPTAADDCGSEALGGTIPVDFQLQWVPQAQFAGYFAAKDLGYYEDAGLDVTFLDGGPTIAPQQVVAARGRPRVRRGMGTEGARRP